MGQPEYDAGLAAGIRARGDGVTSFVCVDHAIQPPTVGEHCSGFADGLGVDLGESMLDSGTDPAEIKNKVLAYLSAHPETNGILTLGPPWALGDAGIAVLRGRSNTDAPEPGEGVREVEEQDDVDQDHALVDDELSKEFAEIDAVLAQSKMSD